MQQQPPPPQNQPPPQHPLQPPQPSQHHPQQHQGQLHHAAAAAAGAAGLPHMPPMIHPLQQSSPQTMQPPAASISTEHIQKCLDDNKQLILAILENQNLGKLQECAQYQQLLQRNLLYLAAIADSQPQIAAPRPQMVPNAHIQQGGPYMQQATVFPPRASLHFNPQQLQEQPQPHQTHHPQLTPMQNPMALRASINNGLHMMHPEGGSGSASGLPMNSNPPEFARGGTSGSLVDGRGGKQDGAVAQEPGSAEQRETGTDSRGGSGEPKEMS